MPVFENLEFRYRDVECWQYCKGNSQYLRDNQPASYRLSCRRSSPAFCGAYYLSEKMIPDGAVPQKKPNLQDPGNCGFSAFFYGFQQYPGLPLATILH